MIFKNPDTGVHTWPSVTAHLASPLSKCLFQQAITESNLGGMLCRNATDASVLGNTVVRLSSGRRAANVSLACAP